MARSTANLLLTYALLWRSPIFRALSRRELPHWRRRAFATALVVFAPSKVSHALTRYLGLSIQIRRALLLAYLQWSSNVIPPIAVWLHATTLFMRTLRSMYPAFAKYIAPCCVSFLLMWFCHEQPLSLMPSYRNFLHSVLRSYGAPVLHMNHFTYQTEAKKAKTMLLQRQQQQGTTATTPAPAAGEKVHTIKLRKDFDSNFDDWRFLRQQSFMYYRPSGFRLGFGLPRHLGWREATLVSSDSFGPGTSPFGIGPDAPLTELDDDEDHEDHRRHHHHGQKEVQLQGDNAHGPQQKKHQHGESKGKGESEGRMHAAAVAAEKQQKRTPTQLQDSPVAVVAARAARTPQRGESQQQPIVQAPQPLAAADAAARTLSKKIGSHKDLDKLAYREDRVLNMTWKQLWQHYKYAFGYSVRYFAVGHLFIRPILGRRFPKRTVPIQVLRSSTWVALVGTLGFIAGRIYIADHPYLTAFTRCMIGFVGGNFRFLDDPKEASTITDFIACNVFHGLFQSLTASTVGVGLAPLVSRWWPILNVLGLGNTGRITKMVALAL